MLQFVTGNGQWPNGRITVVMVVENLRCVIVAYEERRLLGIVTHVEYLALTLVGLGVFQGGRLKRF